MRALLLAAIATLGLLASPVPAAQAAELTLQDRIDTILLEFPGGVQTSANTIEWDDGDVQLALATNGAGPRAVGSCATGKFCVYDGTSLTGSKLSFTACNTTHSTAALLADVRSMANARSSGTVKGLNNAGTVLATVSAGGRINAAPIGIKKVSCTS